MPLYVPLSRPVQDALQRLAWEEKRNPRMQASWLIEQRLRELGTLPPTAMDTGGEDDPPLAGR